MNWIKITYYHTMYQREVSVMALEVIFDNGIAYFSHMGYGEAVEVEYVRKIEALE